MSEDDFDMLLEDDDPVVSGLATGLQCTGLGETVENGESSDDKDGGGAREWTGEEMKLVEPCIELIKVSVDFEYTVQSKIFAGQKFRQAQLPLYCRNIRWNKFHQCCKGRHIFLTQDKKFTDKIYTNNSRW